MTPPPDQIAALAKIHAEAERHFAVVARAWYQQKAQGRKPSTSLSEYGRQFGLTTDEIIRVRMRAKSKVWKGARSDVLIEKINDRNPDRKSGSKMGESGAQNSGSI